jgi:hypothetical protein
MIKIILLFLCFAVFFGIIATQNTGVDDLHWALVTIEPILFFVTFIYFAIFILGKNINLFKELQKNRMKISVYLHRKKFKKHYQRIFQNLIKNILLLL